MSKKSLSDHNSIHATREQQIARLAYERAEARGFAPGHEMDDWLEAEAQVDGNHEPHLHITRPAAARAAAHRR